MPDCSNFEDEISINHQRLDTGQYSIHEMSGEIDDLEYFVKNRQMVLYTQLKIAILYSMQTLVRNDQKLASPSVQIGPK